MASAEHKIEIPVEELELWCPECCIYEVPEILRKEKPEAYTPQLISIGPLHHNEEKLKPMEKQKKLYHHYFQTRLQDSHQKEALTKFKTFLESEENHIRRRYSKKCEHFSEQDQFVQMILLDSVFIMELFLRHFTWNQIQQKKDHSKRTEQENDFMKQIEKDLLFSKLWISGRILQDLVLLENQLPMFVLVELYNNVVPDFDKPQGESFHNLACDYFSAVIDSSHHVWVDRFKKSEHFADLIRYFCLPRDLESLTPGIPKSSYLKSTARKLNEAGITFEKIVSETETTFQVYFEKRDFLNWFPCLSAIPRIKIFKSCLKMPRIMVSDVTEVWFRNLIALEQCHYPRETYICNFVDFLDCLIDTEEDVEFLTQKEIIVKNMGCNEEMASMLNNLCKGVIMSSTYFVDTIDKLNRHHNNGWYHTMTTLKSVYFCDLWRGSATVVGLAVLFFTVFNTVRTFLRGFYV